MPASSSTTASLLKQYRDAGLDYTGIAEFSDVAAFKNGTNDYELEQHNKRKITCAGLKPGTRVWCRFDGRDISEYCFDASASDSSKGDPLITDASGALVFWYIIPNNADIKFKGYKHLIEVSDAPPPVSGGISSGKDGATTRCGQYYYAAPNVNDFDWKDVPVQSSQISLSELEADSSKTVVSSTDVVQELPDYLSQTFVIPQNYSTTSAASQSDSDAHIHSVDLFFSKKPTNVNSSVIVQIRETRYGVPTTNLVGQSAPVTQANISTSVKTSFLFKKGVALEKGTLYALTVIPNEDATDFELYTANKNVPIIGTSNVPVISQYWKSLYGGSTSTAGWSILPDEYLACVINVRTYSTKTELGEVDSTFQFENADIDFLNVSKIWPDGRPTKNSGFQMDETVRGECVLTVANNQTISVGDVINSKVAEDGGSFSTAGFASGTIRRIISQSAGQSVLSVDAFKDFPNSASGNTNNLFFGSGLNQGSWVGNTVSFSAATASNGSISFVNTDFGRLRIKDSSGTFVANTYVRGQEFGAVALIDGIVNPKIDTVELSTSFNAPIGTSLSWEYKATSINGVTDSSWTKVAGASEIIFGQEQKRIYSKSNSANKTLLIRGTMNTNNSSTSPEIDISDLTLQASRERISSNSVNETFPAGGAESRYVSRVLRATPGGTGLPTERLKVSLAGYYPEESSIEIYVRTKNDNDPEPIVDKNYTQMVSYQGGLARSVLGDYSSISTSLWKLSANTDGDNFLGISNILRENSSNNGVLAYRSGDGSVHHGVDEYQLKVVFTRPDGKGLSYSPQVSSLIVSGSKSPIATV